MIHSINLSLFRHSLSTACLMVTLFSCKSDIKIPNNSNSNEGKSVTSEIDSTIIKSGEKSNRIGNNIINIFQDSYGIYWFGSNGEGVYSSHEGRVTHYDKTHGLPDNQVQCISEDADGNIWFGTAKGLSRFDGKIFKDYANLESSHTRKNSIENIKINASDLWFGAGGGVYRYDGKNMSYHFLPLIKQETNYSNITQSERPYAVPAYENTVYYTYKDSKNNVWIATQTKGVAKFDGNSFTWYSGEGLGGPAVRAIFEDRNGNMWFGNNGFGLIKLEGNKLINITKKLGLQNDNFVSTGMSKPGTVARVWAIEQDKNGDLIIGTIDNGVWIYDGKKIKNYTTHYGLSSLKISCIYKNKKGELLFGTEGGGVNVMEGNKFIRKNTF